MYIDDVYFADAINDLDLETEDFLEGFRAEFGTYHAGRLEEDPEMIEYEDLVDLGLSLRN